MKVFDMNTMPRTSLRFIRELAAQSAADGRAEDITLADAQHDAQRGYVANARVSTTNYASVKIKAAKR